MPEEVAEEAVEELEIFYDEPSVGLNR